MRVVRSPSDVFEVGLSFLDHRELACLGNFLVLASRMESNVVGTPDKDWVVRLEILSCKAPGSTAFLLVILPIVPAVSSMVN